MLWVTLRIQYTVSFSRLSKILSVELKPLKITACYSLDHLYTYYFVTSMNSSVTMKLIQYVINKYCSRVSGTLFLYTFCVRCLFYNFCIIKNININNIPANECNVTEKCLYQ